MTYKQGCKYAAHPLPDLRRDCAHAALLPRAGFTPAAQIILFPGWQVVNWLTGGLVSRSFEYKLLLPLIIIGLNVLAWGAVIWSVGNVVETSRTNRA